MDISALVILKSPLKNNPRRTYLLRIGLVHRFLQLLHLTLILVAVLLLYSGDLARADIEGKDCVDEVIIGDAVVEGHVVHQH